MIEIEQQDTIEGKIRYLAEHYSKEEQLEQAGEELKELLKELDRSMQINGSLVLPENTWSEIADVLIMCSQLTMQHGKEEQVRQQLEYKLNRQLQRIEEEQDQPGRSHEEIKENADYRERMLRTFLIGRTEMQKLGRKITLKEQEDFYVALMGEDVCCNGDNNQSTIEELDEAIDDCIAMLQYSIDVNNKDEIFFWRKLLQGNKVQRRMLLNA